MAPHAVGGSHSATVDGNDGSDGNNKVTEAACFSLPTQTPWMSSPGPFPGSGHPYLVLGLVQGGYP